MHELLLGFSPYNIPRYPQCLPDSTHCVGELQGSPEYTWWIKVKTNDEIIGWTYQPDHFSNKDACG